MPTIVQHLNMNTTFYKKLFLLDRHGEFENLKKVRLINYCCLLTILVSGVFIFINLSIEKYLLVAINIATLIIGIACNVLNRKGKSDTAIYTLGIIFSTLASYSAIHFKNGLENYIILNLGVIVLLQKRIWPIVIMGGYNITLYLFTIYYIDIHESLQALPLYRKLINFGICLVMIIIIMQYFKNVHFSYLKEIELQHSKILEQQQELTISKNTLLAKNDELEKINKTKEKLFSIIAHDIKSPMIGLSSSLDLFNKNIISADEFKSLSVELANRVNQLNSNIDNLLMWSQSQMLGIKTKPENINLKDSLLNTLGFLQQILEAKKIKIDIEIPDFIMVNTDPNNLSLVFRNLIGNAIKYSYPESLIYISAKQINQQIEICIKDTGIGMSEETAANLFNPLKINSKYGTQNEKGTGLGLQLCKEFLEKNNGTIKASSTIGKGSEFIFTLPTI